MLKKIIQFTILKKKKLAACHTNLNTPPGGIKVPKKSSTPFKARLAALNESAKLSATCFEASSKLSTPASCAWSGPMAKNECMLAGSPPCE